MLEGQNAPDFKGIDQDNKERSLSDYKGKYLILFFYPKDNTAGCTAEAVNLKENYNLLQEQGFELLGISPDSARSHQKFIEKHQLPFDLIADEDKDILTTYGVWGEKKMYGRTYMGVFRTTFVIDEDLKIKKIFKKVKTKEHTQQILQELEIK